LRQWQDAQAVSLAHLAVELGDYPQGGQISKFECGRRDLPISLSAKLSKKTDIPLKQLLSKEQYIVACSVFALMARDMAA